MTLYSPRLAVNIKQNKIMRCRELGVLPKVDSKSFWKYKNIQVLMTLKVTKDFMVFKQRDLLWNGLL